MTDNTVVPFGKYRGQPIEALSTDPQYMEWLAAQPWFRERYKSLYTIVINNFAPPQEDTPEHNAAQARFLTEEFCLAVANSAWPGWISERDKKEKIRCRVAFEVQGADVEMNLCAGNSSMRFRVEIKPSIGDDYPTILRQMKRDRSNLLFCESYRGSGVSKDDLIAIFKNEHIFVVFSSDGLEQ